MPVSISGNGVLTGIDLDELSGSGTLPKSLLPTGSILQVVSAVKTDTQTGSGTTWVDLTSLSVSITPQSATNKILVMFGVGVWGGTHQNSINVRLLRDSTVVTQGDASGSRIRTAMGHRQSESAFLPSAGAGLTVLDSPNSTSSLTYKLQANGSSSWTINGPSSSTDSATYPLGVSTLVVMEVVA